MLIANDLSLNEEKTPPIKPLLSKCIIIDDR